MNPKQKIQKRTKRKASIRGKIEGTAERPRVSVFRSNNHIYAQIVDDEASKTIVSTNDSKMKKTAKQTKVDLATEVGKELAKKAKAKKIKAVVFDRSGYKYHGRVKAIADGLREGGIQC